MIDYRKIARKVQPECRGGIPAGVVELVHARMEAGMTGNQLGFGEDGHVIEKAIKDAESKPRKGRREVETETQEDAG